MCILFFAVKQHPKYPVIICANRDEFHQRPTKNMFHWPEEKIFAGQDLEAGGTWLGINEHGKFSALTNYRQGSAISPHKKTRGELVLAALAENNIDQSLVTSTHQYHGYNLVYGEMENLQCFDSINQKFHKITDGFHSICNGALDDIWPKMAQGQKLLEQEIQKNEDLSISALFELMTNQTKASDAELPDTGIDKEWEKLLSSIFIVSPDYGTRSTTILTKDVNGNIRIFDRNYNESGEPAPISEFSILN